MNYQNINIEITNLNFQRKYFYSIFGLYLFSLGTTTLGYSIYLLMESLGLVEKNIITWSAQGLFWFLILCLRGEGGVQGWVSDFALFYTYKNLESRGSGTFNGIKNATCTEK